MAPTSQRQLALTVWLTNTTLGNVRKLRYRYVHLYTLNIKISSFYIKFDTVYIKYLRKLIPIKHNNLPNMLKVIKVLIRTFTRP